MKIIVYGTETVSVVNKITDLPPNLPKNAVTMDSSDLPPRGPFRPAWELRDGGVQINLAKAKEICHRRRRIVRQVDFAPWDIKATDPLRFGDEATQAETERQKIRDKDAGIQTKIEEASTVKEVIAIYESLG